MYEKIAKPIVDIIVSSSVGAVVNTAIKHAIPAAANPVVRVQLAVGSFVISSAVAAFTSNHVMSEVDECVNALKKLKNPEKTEEV